MLRTGRAVENIRLLFFNKSTDVYALFTDKGKILVKLYFSIEQPFCLKWRACYLKCRTAQIGILDTTD